MPQLIAEVQRRLSNLRQSGTALTGEDLKKLVQHELGGLEVEVASIEPLGDGYRVRWRRSPGVLTEETVFRFLDAP